MRVTYLITGGAGFIGSAVVRMLVERGAERVVNVDSLTYAGNLESLAPVSAAPNYAFERSDICDAAAMRRIFSQYRPTGVIHLAAESHVDRSIDGPSVFVQTNVVGTFTMLQEARRYWSALPSEEMERFRFLYVSTDEVFGSLGGNGFFVEETPYDPNSPYAASKAAADHLVRAWCRTYGLPCLLTNCSNNFGPYQFPEKLMPLIILNGILGDPLPVYGKGENVRDWLYVDDHANALLTVLERGRIGETYLISGRNERHNIDVVRAICSLLDELAPECLDREAGVACQVRRGPTGARPPVRDRFVEGRAGTWLATARNVRERVTKDRAVVPRQQGVAGARSSRQLPG